MRYASAALLLSVLVAPACANHTPPPTPFASIADTISKLELSGDAILHAAQAAHAQVNPATNQPILSTDALVAVALAGDRLGHVGLRLGQTLQTYSALKAAGQDLTQEQAAVRDLITMATQALKDVGLAVPSGTLAAIDQAVTQSFAILAQIHAAAGL